MVVCLKGPKGPTWIQNARVTSSGRDAYLGCGIDGQWPARAEMPNVD